MKPWNTKEWKEKREDTIKDHCEQCGTKEGIMVLHHLWQPPSFYDIRYEITCALIDEAIKNGKVKYPTEKRNACPQCKSLSISYRKTMSPRWRCIKCELTFNKPVKVDYVSNVNRKLTFKRFQEENSEQINSRAELLSEENHQKYISMGGTVTFCKKCAFLWDMKHLRLCPECRTRYMKMEANRCFDCNERARGSNVPASPGQLEEIKQFSDHKETKKEDQECLTRFLAGRAPENLSMYEAGCLIRELLKIYVPQRQACGLIAFMDKRLLFEESLFGEIDGGECWYCEAAGFPQENRTRCEQLFKKSR